MCLKRAAPKGSIFYAFVFQLSLFAIAHRVLVYYLKEESGMDVNFK